jgi:hypothetical protein
MVCPSSHGPTGSRTLWNIAPGQHTELTKSYKMCVAFVLRSVDRMCSIENMWKVPFIVELSQKSTLTARRQERTAGHRSVVVEKKEELRGSKF